jgi:hypothetical protein
MPGPWVMGALVANVWSYAGSGQSGYQSPVHAALRELQHGAGLVPDFLSYYHGQLGSEQRAEVDGPSRRWVRQNLSDWAPTDERLNPGVLSCREAGPPGRLVDASGTPIHVSEVTVSQ